MKKFILQHEDSVFCFLYFLVVIALGICVWYLNSRGAEWVDNPVCL